MSIANDKKSELTPLEFQHLGSASSSTMLIQPLLEHASTYNCHLVKLAATLSNTAVPPNAPLFKVVLNPILTYTGDAELRDDDGINVDACGITGQEDLAWLSEAGKPYADGVQMDFATDVDLDDEVEDFHNQVQSGAVFSDNWYTKSNTDDAIYMVSTPEHCVSSTDFVWKLQQSIKDVSGRLYMRTDNPEEKDDGSPRLRTDDAADSLIKLKVNMRGI